MCRGLFSVASVNVALMIPPLSIITAVFILLFGIIVIVIVVLIDPKYLKIPVGAILDMQPSMIEITSILPKIEQKT